MIRLVHRSVLHTRFWVYFGLLEESASQNFKERKHICTKIRVDMMKGWNMIVKMKIIKNFIKGIDKKMFEKRKKRI